MRGFSPVPLFLGGEFYIAFILKGDNLRNRKIYDFYYLWALSNIILAIDRPLHKFKHYDNCQGAK